LSNTDLSADQAAHLYRNRGWRVIPLHRVGPDGLTCSCRKGRNCASKGKHPLDTAWQNTPELSGADIEALFGTDRPPNIGIATGAPSGFWVLDIDPEKGGLESWQRIKAGRPMPETYAVRTGSGGWHFYFEMPTGFEVTNSPAAFKGTGIDIRGTGGQVVAPPSRTDKGDYVAFDRALNHAPDWLLEMVRPQAPAGPVVMSSDVPDRSNLPESERKRLDQYARKAITANVERLQELARLGWNGEPWNNTTFEVACALLELANSPWNGYTQQRAYQHLFDHAPRDPEFDDETVNKIFQSAVTKVGDKARAMPEGRPPDDFMTADTVRKDPRLSDPTLGSGAPATPAAGTAAAGPERFFHGKDFLVGVLGQAVVDEGPLAFGVNRDFWRYENGVWKSDPDVVEKRVLSLMGNRYRNTHRDHAKVWVKHNVRHLHDDPDGRYINFANGMLEWETGELLEHSEDFESTVQLGTVWDPGAECKHFDSWLAEVLEPDFIPLAWEMIGYLMYSGNPLQVAFMLYGTGGNGKGTLIRVICDLLGEGNYASESLEDLNTHRFSAVNLFGRIANIAGDIDGTYQESTANFKKLTGEDVYAAEKKFGDRFTFKSWAVPVFSANKIPGSADVSEGYLRRWVILEFTRTFANPVRSLSDSLSDELPGIARKGVEALRVLMTRGKFDPRGAAARARDMFAETIDQSRQWVKHGVQPAPEHHETCHSLYRSYTAWADQQNLGKLKRQEFCHRLEALGYTHVDQPSRGHVGLRPLDTSQPVVPTPSSFFTGAN